MKRVKIFVISVLIPLLVGGLSAALTYKKIETYAELNKPALSPPGAMFGIVWSVLFILMGISSAIIYMKRDEKPEEAAAALRIYAFQLAINFFWPIIFFNLGAYLFAFIWILLTMVFVALMISAFRKISPLAAYLQLPYLLWLIFAGYLNLMIFIMN